MTRGLLAGYGEMTITPEFGTELTGFGFYLRRRAEEVVDDLKVRALSLRSPSQSLLLISCDLIGLTVDFCNRIRRRLAARQGIPTENTLLASTHTHSGPASQPLIGLGRINPAFIRWLPAAIEEAASRARADEKKAEFGFHSEVIEPIGFNRRERNFAQIDPWLLTAVFKQRKKRIFLLNYACHPVTLGPSRAVSADWPGAAVAEIEKEGDRALVFQGFCGDIDPVAYLNRRLGGTKEDITLMGKIIASRAIKSERFIRYEVAPALAAGEERIRLPLQVFPKSKIGREFKAAFRSLQEFPGGRRVVEVWRRRVEKKHADFLRSPWMEGVPVHALTIGSLRILGLPGEVFCGLGLKLRRRFSSLMTVGYANGNVGYLPTRRAFREPEDYACYVAPRFYSLFPFSPQVESIILRASRKILTSLP